MNEQNGYRLSPAEREQMMIDHLPQVHYLARRIHERLPESVLLEDLVSAGTLGLIDAIEKFDPAKNVQFRSYAQFRIRGAILDSLRAVDWSPRELRRKARAIEEAAQRLASTLGRAPTDQETADAMQMPLRSLQELMGELRGLEIGTLTVENLSDETVQEERSASLTLDEEPSPFDHCLESEMKKLLAWCIDRLGDREKQVLALYYFEELTMKEIGAVLGVVESRVSQVHTAAVVKMRAMMRHALRGRGNVIAELRADPSRPLGGKG